MMFLLSLVGLLHAQEPCIPTDIAELTTRVGNLLLDEKLEEAFMIIENMEDIISCANSHLWPYQISMLYQTRAAVVSRIEGEAAARPWYEAATRMAPSVPFNASLYPSGRGAFAAALETAEHLPVVQISAPGGAILDGIFIPPGSSRLVPQGTHVVQYISETGALITDVADLQFDTWVGTALQESQRTPALMVSAGFTLVGGALLGGSTYWHRRAGEYTLAGLDEARAVRRTANVLTIVGVGAIAAGSGILVGAALRADGAVVSFTVVR